MIAKKNQYYIIRKLLLFFLSIAAPLLLQGQSRADFEIQLQEGNEVIVKIPFSEPIQELWNQFRAEDESTILERLEQYFKENLILYGSNGQPLNLQNLGAMDTNPSDKYPNFLELIFEGKNIARIENRCFDMIEGHENHHKLIKTDGTLIKEFKTSTNKPVHLFPMKMAGARLFPTNHPFWVFLGIAAFIAIVVLGKRISKT